MTRRVWIIASLLGVVGCVATDVGNPQTDPGTDAPETNAQMRAVLYDESVPNALMLDDGVEITHAWIVLRATSLVGCETEVPEGEEESEQPEMEDEELIVADLISGAMFPRPVRLMQRGIRFCEIEIEIGPADARELPDGAPADLAERSMLVRGKRKDGVPFVVRAGFSEDFTLQGDLALEVDSPNDLLLGFAANGWISHASLAEINEDIVEIDAQTHIEIYESFRDAVVASPRLFIDDGDGVLSSREALDPIAIPAQE